MQNKHKVLVLGPLPEPALALFDARDDIESGDVSDLG